MVFQCRGRLGLLLVALVLLQPCIGRAQQGDIRLSIDPASVTRIKDWGLTIARIEWDGHYQLPSEEVQRKLFSDLGATTVRVVIGRDSYYDETKQSVKREEADRVLGAQLDNIKRYGIRRYIVSIITAPRFTKRYYTYDSSVDLDENYLRRECESDFAAYLEAILVYIKSRGAPLPEEVSIVVMPDIGGGLDGGCFYTADQWVRVMMAVRRTLDMNGFGGVGLIGPETYSPEGTIAFLSAYRRSASPAAPCPLSGIALSLGRKTAWSAGDYVSVGQEIAKLSPAEAGVWMLDEHTGSISNDRDTLATVFERMGRDLVFYGADHWCWNFGFMTDRSETTLLWGNEGNETPLFRALKELWNRAPPGFEVHRIISSSPAIATFDPKRVDVFALVEGSKAVVVVVNDGEKEMSLAIEGVKAEGSTVSIYTGEARRTVGLSSGSKASIPGRSIAFIAADRAK